MLSNTMLSNTWLLKTSSVFGLARKLSGVMVVATVLAGVAGSRLQAQDCCKDGKNCNGCQCQSVHTKSDSLDDIPFFSFVKAKPKTKPVAPPSAPILVRVVNGEKHTFSAGEPLPMLAARELPRFDYHTNNLEVKRDQRQVACTDPSSANQSCKDPSCPSCTDPSCTMFSTNLVETTDRPLVDHLVLARQLIGHIASSSCDEEDAAELIGQAMDKVAASSRLAASIQIERIKAQHAEELASVREAVFLSQQNQLAMQFQQKLAPITYRQDRTQQMLIEFETRLLEMQQTVHQMQQQAKSSSPTIKLTRKPANNAHDNGTCAICNQPFYYAGVPATTRMGDRVFKNVRQCDCDRASERLQESMPQPREWNLTEPPLNSPPVYPTHDQTSLELLQLRIRQLEQQFSHARQQPNRFVEQSPHAQSGSNIEHASYEEEVNPLIPSPVIEPLMPVPVAPSMNSYDTNLEPIHHSNFIPRDDSRNYHNWFSKTYYVGNLLPHPTWNDKSRNGQAYDDYAEQLIDEIKRRVEPDSWTNNEFAKIRFLPHTLSLRVMQTHSNHQEIEALLDQAVDNEAVFSFFMNVNR